MAHTNIFSNGLVWLGKAVFFFNAPAWAAMWIFYTLSGFLAGLGFAKRQIAFTLSGIRKYYYKKILRIWMPAVLFIFLTCILVYPDFLPTYPYVIKNFFFCTYGSMWENPAVDGVGATWFVFTLMWLYLAAPLLGFIGQKIGTAKRCVQNASLRTGCYLSVIALALLLGEGWRQYCAYKGLSWFHYVYTPPYANISVFAAGVFFAFLVVHQKESKEKGRGLKALAICFLGGLMLLFSYMFYAYGIAGMTTGFWGWLYFFYQNSAPGVVCVATLFFLYAFYQNGRMRYGKPTLGAITQNPFRLIDAFSGISFEFYLMHSLVLSRIRDVLRTDSPIREWFLIASVAFLISTMMAYFYASMLDTVYTAWHLRRPLVWARAHPQEALFIYLAVIVCAAALYCITVLPF